VSITKIAKLSDNDSVRINHWKSDDINR